MTHVTCKLTAKNRDQLRNPTLGNRVWPTFLYAKITLKIRLHYSCNNKKTTMYQIDYQYMTKVSMLKVLRCFYTWLWKHSFHIQSINLTNKIIIKTSQKLQTICFSYLTIVSCGTMEWIVGSGSMENPCGGTVWGTTLPSMVN